MLSNPGDGGYSVDEALLEWVYSNLGTNKTILELGAGESTRRFKSLGYNVISIEHDPAYVGLVPGVTYIHAPIEHYNEKYDLPPSIKKRVNEQTGWYNRESISKGLRDLRYDLILIDGPPRNFGRGGFLANIGLFRTDDVTLIFDDMHRHDDIFLARRVASLLGRDLLIKNNGFEVIGQKNNGDMKAQEKKPFGIV